MSESMTENNMSLGETEDANNKTFQPLLSPAGKFPKEYISIDKREAEQMFDNIQAVFGDAPNELSIWQSMCSGSENKETNQNLPDDIDGPLGAENGTVGVISMDKMEKVIRSIDTTSNPFHSFMNIIPGVFEHTKDERKDLLDALTEIDTAQNNQMNLEEFKKFTGENELPKTTTRTWKCISTKIEPTLSPNQKLLVYFKAIAESKKIYLKKTQVFMPGLIVILSVLHFIFNPSPQLEFDT